MADDETRAENSDTELPDPEATRAQPDAPVASKVSTSRFGSYRLVHVIGEGGMGTVYKAEQDHPRRLVALKVIKPGLVSLELLRRFDREAEVLGRLQHLGIAHIYDAGTARTPYGAQPYFAMEYVADARSLTGDADEKRLNVDDRLALTAKVCDAVHHAHQRGVIPS